MPPSNIEWAIKYAYGFTLTCRLLTLDQMISHRELVRMNPQVQKKKLKRKKNLIFKSVEKLGNEKLVMPNNFRHASPCIDLNI